MVVRRPWWVRVLYGCYTTTDRRGDDHARDPGPGFFPGLRRHLLRRLRGIPDRAGVAGRHYPRTVDLGVRRLRHDRRGSRRLERPVPLAGGVAERRRNPRRP